MRELADKIDNTAPAATGRLPAAEFNAFYTEAENLAKAIGRTLDTDTDTVLTMIAQATAAYASAGIHGLDTGGVNAYVVGKVDSSLWMPFQLFRGMAVRFTPSATNNGASTLNAWGLGAKPIVTFDGEALAGGEIVQNRPTEMFYHPTIITDGAFVLCPWASALGLDQGGGDPPIGGGGQTFVFNIPDSYNYNLKNDLVARGADLSQDITVVATLPTGGMLGGGEYAFRTGTGFTAGSSLKLVVGSGAHIIGHSGAGANGGGTGGGNCADNGTAGGPALYAETAITIDNQGVIAGGGGGGGRYGQCGANWHIGHGGGHGAGNAHTNPANFKTVVYNGQGSIYWNVAGDIGIGGAAGGGWGEDGSDISGGLGGDGGDAVRGNANITWENTGNRYGGVVN